MDCMLLMDAWAMLWVKLCRTGPGLLRRGERWARTGPRQWALQVLLSCLLGAASLQKKGWACPVCGGRWLLEVTHSNTTLWWLPARLGKRTVAACQALQAACHASLQRRESMLRGTAS